MPPLRVAIDLTALTRPVTGTERYSIELSKALLSSERDIQFILLFRKNIHKDLEGLAESARTYISPFQSQLLTEQLWIPHILRKIKPDLVHFPFFPPSPATRMPLVMTLFDANLWLHPETLSMKTRLYTKPLTQAALRRARRVFVISGDYRQDLLDRAGVQDEQIEEAGIGISEYFRRKDANPQSILHELRIHSRFILAVGTLEPRKNYLRLILAFAQLHRDAGTEKPVLVIAGRKAWATSEILSIIRKEKLDGYVHLIGHIPDEKLRALYQCAECLVCPSIYEGFGLPVFEAVMCGTPVVCSNIPPFNFHLRDCAIFVDPLDPISIANGLRNVLLNESIRDSARAKTVREQNKIAAAFSWDAVAGRVAEVYHQA